MTHIFRLIRYKNLLMLVLIMLLTKYGILHYLQETNNLTVLQTVLIIFSVINISAGGYIVNDMSDLVADRINKPHKLYIEDQISSSYAWRLYLLTNSLGLIAGCYVCFILTKPWNTLLFIIPILLLFVYSKYLKRLALIGNVVISLLAALVIFMLYAFTDRFAAHGLLGLDFILMYFMSFSFLTTLIREIIKDIEDIKGDYKQGMKTLPILLGRIRARNIAILLSIVFAMSLIVVNQLFLNDAQLWLIGMYNYAFILLPLLYFIYILWNADKRKTYTFLSNYMKWIMLIGILSMSLLII